MSQGETGEALSALLSGRDAVPDEPLTGDRQMLIEITQEPPGLARSVLRGR